MNLPNKLTLLRIVMIPVFVFFYLADSAYQNYAWGFSVPHNYLWALLIFALASLTDLLDGHIARSRGLITDFGKLMDPLADKLLVMSAMVCFVHTKMASSVVVILILAREFLVTSIRLLAAGKGTVLAADVWGKLKTVFQMLWICTGLFVQWNASPYGLFADISVRTVLFYVYQLLAVAVVLLTLYSGFHYIWKNRALFRDR